MRKILGLFGGSFRGDSGDLWGRGGEEVFPVIWRGSSGVFEAHPGTPVLSAPIPHFLLRLMVSIPGAVGVPIKGIVVHG